MSAQSVTVIGLGPMGRAMANAFLDGGHRVTVWNRTASRADELVDRGAVRAATAGDALAANELVVLSLTDHDAMYTILGPAAAALPGRVLVNLSSDTPEKSRAAAEWATGHGARYLTGGVLTPPSGIGRPEESSTLYSGPREVFAAHQETLEVLTGTDYRGADPGLAALYYQLQMDMFWTAMLGYLHAVAVADANGITAREILPYATGTLSLSQFIEFYTPRIDAGEHSGDVDRIAMGTASIDHVVHTAREAGIDASLPAAVRDVFRRGMADGRADGSFTGLIEVFKKAAA